MAWTKEQREHLLWELEYFFTPEQVARLPKAVQRGDRDVRGEAEWELWRELMEEFTWKKAEWQRKQFAELPPEYQAKFPKEVVAGERPMDMYELKFLQQLQQGLWTGNDD